MNRFRFEPSPEEVKLIEEWIKLHLKSECIYPHMCCFSHDDEMNLIEDTNHQHTTDYRYVGAAGGQFSFEFAPTGLGVCVTVKCSCGKEQNCTDYDSW